jgi:hypothetical protein
VRPAAWSVSAAAGDPLPLGDRFVNGMRSSLSIAIVGRLIQKLAVDWFIYPGFGILISLGQVLNHPVSCAAMKIGAPHVAVSGLVELHHLLIEGGFRRSSRDDSNVVQEEHYEDPAGTGAATDYPTPAQHGGRFCKPSGNFGE